MVVIPMESSILTLIEHLQDRLITALVVWAFGIRPPKDRSPDDSKRHQPVDGVGLLCPTQPAPTAHESDSSDRLSIYLPM